MRSTGASHPSRLGRALARLRDAVGADDQRRAADADLGYQMAVVAAAELPRVTRQFEQLTWQVKIFISSLDISYQQHLSDMLTEVEALDDAINVGDEELAERLWREKFERWVRDFVGRIDDSFDRDLWVALTSGARGAS
jgi:DNA-binding GntR family transcriptional regulator